MKLIVLAIVAATLAQAAIINLREPDAKHSEGSSSEWTAQLKALKKLLPDDLFWEDSVHGLTEQHKGEVLDICTIAQFTCNSHHELEAISLVDVRGRVDWSILPATVQFVTISDSKFKFGLSLTGVPDTLQSLRYFNCLFDDAKGSTTADDVTPSHLREFVCEACGLKQLPWTALSKLRALNVARNDLLEIPAAQLSKALRFANFSFAAKHVDFSGKLPATLNTLDMSGTEQTAIPELPSTLDVLVMAHNQISGKLDVSKLPESLSYLDLSHNQLTDELPSFAALKKLAKINLSFNKLTGFSTVDFPPAITSFVVSHNSIAGKVDFKALPESLTVFDVGFNKLSGPADLTELPPKMDTLSIENNAFSGNVDFTKFPATMRFVFAQKNQFTGRPDISKLPLDLRRILFGGNKWTSLMPPP